MNSKLQNILAFVQAHPGAKWWVEEILFRGRPHATDQGGMVNGGHVVFGAEFPALDGSVVRQTVGPIPLAVLGEAATAAEIPMATLLPILQQAQAQTIAELTDTVAARDATITTHEKTIADMTTAASAKDATIAELTAQVAKLTADLEAGEVVERG